MRAKIKRTVLAAGIALTMCCSGCGTQGGSGSQDLSPVSPAGPAAGTAEAKPKVQTIHQAVKAGAIAEVRRLLAQNPAEDFVKRRDEKGWAPLHYAADAGRADIARVLLEHGADLNATVNTPYHNATALFLAAAKGHRDTVELLVGSGADPKIAAADVFISLGANGRLTPTELGPPMTAAQVAEKGGHADVSEVLKNPLAQRGMENRDDEATPKMPDSQNLLEAVKKRNGCNLRIALGCTV